MQKEFLHAEQRNYLKRIGVNIEPYYIEKERSVNLSGNNTVQLKKDQIYHSNNKSNIVSRTKAKKKSIWERIISVFKVFFVKENYNA